MKTTPDALKDLYEAFGGEASAVAEMDKTVDVLNAFAAKYEGKADAVVIPEAIENIVEVADNIGGGGSVKVTLVAEQSFTCDNYGEASVTAELYFAGFDGKDATIVFDGVTFTAPIVYKNDSYLQIGEWADGWFDFEKVPVGFEIYADSANAYTAGAGQHTAEVFVLEDPIVPSGIISITENGIHDVAAYYAAEVEVEQPSINLTIVNQLSNQIRIRGYDDKDSEEIINANTTKTFKCYGRSATNEEDFRRIVKITLYGQGYDMGNTEVKLNGAQYPEAKWTAEGNNSTFLVELNYSPAQDLTYTVYVGGEA